MIKLSIIIPYYNVKPYTDELLDRLAPQITDEVEVILVDDGSKEIYETKYKEWCTVYRQKNKGVSAARNKGLELSHGEYIAFIDSDDLVAPEYVCRIFSKMPFDYLDMSWKSLPDGQQFSYKLNSEADRLKNPSAVTRVFSRAAIGDIRFNEQKQAAEDAEFVMNVCKPDMKVAVITEYNYFYRTATPNSLTKRYLSGDMDTKRIVYHYNHITADMIDLLEEIKRENERHEIYVLTNRNDIPDLSLYAKVMAPCKVRGMELRGEPWEKFTKILPTPYFDIVIYTSQHDINGIYTWIYSFCRRMSTAYKYDIAVAHDGMKTEMISRLSTCAYVVPSGSPVKCHTLLMMKLKDTIPSNIRYEHSIQIVHSPRLSDLWELPKDRDELIPVSKVVKDSWGLSADPIHNLTVQDVNVLSLISVTRLSTKEKGLDRMKQLCYKLKEARINFEWDLYGDFDPGIKGITYKGQTTDIRKKIRAADYLVQLSDAEGFCYSIVEALEEGTPIISTPLPILKELGIKDKVHGHIIPFDMDFDISIITDIPPVKFLFDNTPSLEAWRKKLGKATGKGTVNIQCVSRYRDMTLGRYIEQGEILTLSRRRASEVIECGFAKEVRA